MLNLLTKKRISTKTTSLSHIYGITLFSVDTVTLQVGPLFSVDTVTLQVGPLFSVETVTL